MNRFTRKTMQAVSAAVLLASAGISQAQIAVDVDINIGAITILYAFDDIDVNIPNTALAAILAGTATCATGTLSEECNLGDGGGPVNAAENAGNLEANFNINVPCVAPANNVNLVLQNVWAVRAIGGTTANTTVDVIVPGGTTITNGTSSIGVNSATATPGTFTDPGLGTPQVGDVTLNLDFTNVDAAGNHDSGADTGDTVYTIEVTAT
jgi:hypothetical protein